MTTSDGGRGAASPWAIPAAGWKQVVVGAWREAGHDNIGLIASGVAYCAILAMVPMLAAVVLTYGIVATPETVVANVRSLTAMMPAEAATLIGEQLSGVVTASDGKKGLGLIVAIGIALYGAMKGAAAIVTALNIAYDEEETRGFLRLNLLALAVTVGAVLAVIVAVVAIAAMAALQALFPAVPAAVLVLGKVASYAVVAAGGAAAAATLYRYAPDRGEARWVWLSPGSVFASLAWLAMTLGFGVYVANFGSYDATYGSLGAAVVLLTWLYLSAYVLLLGAELDGEVTRRTARGTDAADTIGSEGPAAPAATTGDWHSAAPLLAVAGLALLRRRRAAAGLGLLVAAAAISRRRRR